MSNYEVGKEGYVVEDLKYIIDNIPYAVWIKGSDGIYKYVNKYYASITDMLPEDIIGKNDYQIRDDKTSELFLAEDREILDNEKTVINRKIPVTIGYRNVFEVSRMIIDRQQGKDIDNDLKLIGGIGKNITLYENLYKEIEKCTLNLLDDSKDEIKSELLYILKDLLKADGITIFILDKEKTKLNIFLKTFDDSLMPKDFSVILSDEVREMCINSHKFNKCLEREHNGHNGIEYIRTFFIHFEDELIGILNVHYDNKESFLANQECITTPVCDRLGVIIKNRILTNKYKDELKKRKETEQKLKIFLDNSIDFYVIIKDDKLYFEDEKNKEMIEQFFGYGIDEIEKRRMNGKLRFSDDEKAKELFEVAKKCRKVEGAIIRYKCSDNECKSIEWTVRYVEDGDKYFVTGKDLTEKLKLKNEKRELEKTVEVESLKTEFFANMSHEFKTPLNIILTTVQLLLDKMNSNESMIAIERLENYLKGVKQNSYRLLKIVNNIMDINKIDSGCYDLQLGNYNIVSIVEDIVMSVSSYMEQNKRNIVFDTVEEEVITACDPIKIERVILNLLSNSLKYTYENGNIEVFIDMDKEKNEVIISVKNDGDPISDEDKERIFERFIQSENIFSRKREGTGIGLFLVRMIVEMHGGRIYVDNSEKKGTKFVIVLPIRTTDDHKAITYNKEIISKVETCNIEFSDIYSI